MVFRKHACGFKAGRRKLLMIFSALLALAIVCGSAHAAPINWVDFTSLEKESKAAGKPRLIYFYSDYCGYCTKMEKETFSNEKVASYLNENFVASQVNTQKDQKLAIQFMVRAVPTTVFINADGTPIDSLAGYIDADIFFWMLKYIGSKEINNMDFMEFLKKNNVEHPMVKAQ